MREDTDQRENTPIDRYLRDQEKAAALREVVVSYVAREEK